MLGGLFPSALRLSRSLLRGSIACCGLSAMAGDEAETPLRDFFEYMERLRIYEHSGMPCGAGTDFDDGFDLGRIRRVLRRLGNPHIHFPAVHIAGSKGKRSTAAFLLQYHEGARLQCGLLFQVGLGGARDATNVIPSTELAASVITTVGRQHLVALGASLQSIAIAKSGNIKQGRPVY